MNNSILARDKARFMGLGAAMLAATLAALLAVFVLAKPSKAEEPILTVHPSSVDFGSVTVDADTETRTITVTNNGGAQLFLGGFEILGNDTGAFEVSGLDSNNLLTVNAGGTATFEVTYEPVETGLETVQLTFDTFNSLTDALGGVVGDVEAPTVNLTGQGVSTNPTGSGCTITGGPNSETLRGTRGKDVICARGGNDTVRALRGNDTVRGGKGSDAVRSSKGRDILKGGAGADRLTDKLGRRGDRLFGQRGKDVLNTKDSRRGDVLVGGPGRDKAYKDRGDRARSI